MILTFTGLQCLDTKWQLARAILDDRNIEQQPVLSSTCMADVELLAVMYTFFTKGGK